MGNKMYRNNFIMAKVKYFIFEANKYIMIVNDIMTCLEELAPLSYAEDFDNVGLLVGNKNNEVTGILVTLDTLQSYHKFPSHYF